MTKRAKQTWLIAVIGIPLLFGAIALLQRRIDAQTRTVASEQEDLVLRSPALIKRMSLGYQPLLADIYWTRAVQYYGDRVAVKGSKFDLLWPLLDITTTLDPKMVVAYRFGAIFLAEPGLGGANRPDLAVELVKRGINANPNEWHLYADLGFIYYWWMRDYQASSQAYLAGSKNSNAPPWLGMMAARIAQKGGSLQTSIMIWAQIYDTTHDAPVKKRALQMLQGLKAQQDEQQLNQLAEEYKQRKDRYPTSIEELHSAGLIGGVPVDPLGFPYVLGPNGESKLNPNSTVVIPPEPKTPPQPFK
jgi:hypothetical protein